MYKAIVVGTDGSPTVGEAVTHVLELAKMSGATLHLVRADKLVGSASVAIGAEVGLPGVDVKGVNEAIVAQSAGLVATIADEAKAAGVTCEMHSMPGDAADVLIDVAEHVKADLIVVGNRGMTGKKRFVLGSVPNKVAHHTPCNVLIVHTTG